MISKLYFLFCKGTRNLNWNRTLSDKIEDSRGAYVFSDREKKTNSGKKIRRFPSSSHHFLAKSPSRANFWAGNLNGSLRNKRILSVPIRTWGRITQIFSRWYSVSNMRLCDTLLWLRCGKSTI